MSARAEEAKRKCIIIIVIVVIVIIVSAWSGTSLSVKAGRAPLGERPVRLRPLPADG